MSRPLLRRLQSTLQHQNDLNVEVDVRRFVLDTSMKEELAPSLPDVPEQLLLYEDDESIEVGLFLDDGLLDTLEEYDPYVSLSAHNFEHFCIALEGVSHFVFVSWCIEKERSVSPLELELQAEVDKFVTSWSLLTQQGRAPDTAAKALERVLFRGYVLRDDIPSHEQERYHVASRAASEFCAQLARTPTEDELLKRSRAFARQSLPSKLRGGAAIY